MDVVTPICGVVVCVSLFFLFVLLLLLTHHERSLELLPSATPHSCRPPYFDRSETNQHKPREREKRKKKDEEEEEEATGGIAVEQMARSKMKRNKNFARRGRRKSVCF